MNEQRENNHSSEIKALLVRAADGKLDDTEQARLDNLLLENPTLASEIDEQRAVTRALSEFGVRDPNPDDWDRFENKLFPKTERMVGWILLLVSYAVLIGFGLFEAFTDPKAPFVFKMVLSAGLLGFFVLMVHVGRRALREYRRDPYKDVIR